MTPIVPSTTVLVPTVAAGQPAVTPAAPIAPVAGTILSSGMAVTQLQAGAMLRGTVVGRNESGQLVIDTPRGRLLVATPANLPAGSEIVVHVRSGGQQPQVTLQQVLPEGHTPARAPGAAPGQPSPSPSGGGAAVPTAPTQSQLTGFATTAVVVSGPQTPMPASRAQPAAAAP
jgi:hypothetical protein